MEKSIYTSQQKRLQELLHQLRQEAGLRQIDLAKRLGVPQSFVSKYESGERRLDILELRAVCASLGISLQKFVRRLENALSEIPDQES
ncbi:MAG: helix-turn-helix transcriptional regulator [Syntrophobacteraceae bacterium]|jgi:transcriptional regulator with XRE-family HTH domain